MNDFLYVKKQVVRVGFAVILICTAIHSSAQKTTVKKLTSFVDPFIGSGGHGHVFIGASVPFGAVQVGPDNFYKGWDWCSGYNYQDSVIRGFAQTHLSGTGIGDLSDIAIMPYVGEIKTDKGQEKIPGSGYSILFSHKDEKVKPGYYAVKLASGVFVELTASERVGYHRYHFPLDSKAHVIIDLKEGINDQSTDTYLEQVDDYTFKGYRRSSGWAKDQMIYFAIKSSLPVKDFNIYNDNTLLSGRSGKNKAIKGLISFAQSPSLLELKVGISPVSEENALANIQAEIPNWNFGQIVKLADDKWNGELAKLTVEGGTTQKKTFYTAMYHTMINPSLFNDHNGDYRGTDKKIYRKADFDNYSVFSTWDTYRAAHPLFLITQPKRVSDMVNSMLAIYKQQGMLPIWPLMGNETGTMVGISSMQIVAEAYLKGIKGFDASSAFEALKRTAMLDTLGLRYVKNLQPIPSDQERRSTAKGLEYAISDGSIALMAKAMKKTEDYAYFKKRAKNYKLYFDPSDRFFKGKLSNSNWTPGFDPMNTKNDLYAEGNGWQYNWLVPQDVSGLIDLLHGDDTFNYRLDEFFKIPFKENEELADMTGLIGQYAHGNEPGHHIPYLYAYSGQQWKTAEKVSSILKEMYHDRPDGIIGNEDCGQMSAWFVFSSLGFYPVFPASGIYVIGSPMFNKSTIRLNDGKKFVVQTVNVKEGNIYVQSIELNGKKYEKSFIKHTDIMKGGLLKITMGKQPNYTYGTLQKNRPH